MATRPPCAGVVTSFAGHHVQFTGSFRRGREKWTRSERAALLGRMGIDVAAENTRGRYLTLLIVGDLDKVAVTDEIRRLSQHGRWVADEREAGNHVCMIDEFGFDLLIQGEQAPCLQVAVVKGNEVVFSGSPPPTPFPFTTLLPRSATPTHEETGLALDLSALDRGTAAHHATVEALRDHVAPTQLLSSAGLPKFDAAWRTPARPDAVHVAEVKSLTGSNQDQQVRLGIGQVLDYCHAIRSMRIFGIEVVQAVLVLQHQPTSKRWLSLAESMDLIITWAPDFPRIREDDW